ncbi:putative reverse transcriptase domain-containing protein, partial [Tanacetum coccineum]
CVGPRIDKNTDGPGLGSLGQGGGDFLEEKIKGNTNIRAQHILDALCGDGSATATDLLKSITSVINLWLAGRGLVSKVAMKGVGKEMSKYVSDFQFGVRVSGGTEAVLHSVNKVIDITTRGEGKMSLSISLWVDFLYVHAMRLYIGDTHIWYAIGVQQGDPLDPLLFALVLHPLVHKIKDNCMLLLHAWYLDDGTVIGDPVKVARVLDIIRVSGLCLGLELNIKKTKIFWPLCNGTKLHEGLFPVDIRRQSLGVKLLGGAVSRDTDFISGLVMRRAANAVDLIGLLLQLHDLRAEISAKKEAPVNFLTDPLDGRFTLKPADILIFG